MSLPVPNETSRFRDLHTKTHDIELLLSGALVFGLLTVPGDLNRLFDTWSARFDGIASSAATYLYLYAQMIVYSMLVTFITHLCLRGYWIALLGLESVWSDGWNWERLKLGPHSRAHVERRVGSLSVAINNADDRASVIFAAGALLVMMFLYSLGMVGVAIAVSMLIGAATGIPSRSAFSVAFVAVFLPMIVIPLLDRRLAGKLNPDGLAHRVFARIAGAGLFLSPLRFIGPIQFVFQSRLGQRKLGIALGMASAVIMASLLVSVFLRSGELRLDGWTYFDPRPTGASIDPGHYRDSGATRTGRRPTIDSDVIAGPVIRLYLPYRPRRHNTLIAGSCPVLAAAVETGAGLNNATAATCLGNLYKVSLDGAVVTTSYRFTRDAASEFVGVLAYLPTAGLAPGPHELAIDGPGGNPNAPREVITIPFYSMAK
jgi:hypothetical protein